MKTTNNCGAFNDIFNASDREDENPKSWGLQYAIINKMNDVIICQRPTTQEDNFGQIIDRFDIYHKPHFFNNGICSDMKDGKYTKAAHLVKYMNGNYSLFINGFRIEDVQVQLFDKF